MRSKKGNLVCCGCDRDYMSTNSKKTDDHHARNKEEKREEKKVAREREVSPPAPKY